MERRAEPEVAGHSPESQDRPAIIGSSAGGLIRYWCQDPTGGFKPINAKSETVARLERRREVAALIRTARGDAGPVNHESPA
jgi:hypothetical protein